MRRRPQVKAVPITRDRLAAATHMRRGQPGGVRWEIQARLARRYAIDTDSVCYRSAGAQGGVRGVHVGLSQPVRMPALQVLSCFYPEIVGEAGLLRFVLAGCFRPVGARRIENEFRHFVPRLGNAAKE